MRDIVILGSTGSIGVQALEVVASHPQDFRVVGLAAGSRNISKLADQAKKFDVPIIATTGAGDELKNSLAKRRKSWCHSHPKKWS